MPSGRSASAEDDGPTKKKKKQKGPHPLQRDCCYLVGKGTET